MIAIKKMAKKLVKVFDLIIRVNALIVWRMVINRHKWKPSSSLSSSQLNCSSADCLSVPDCFKLLSESSLLLLPERYLQNENSLKVVQIK